MSSFHNDIWRFLLLEVKNSIFLLLFWFDIIGRFRNQTIFVEHIPNPAKVAKKTIKKNKKIILTTCQLHPYWYHVSTLNLCRCPLHLGWVKVNFNVTIRPHASFTATGLPSLLLGARIILGMSCLPTQISSLVPPIDSIQAIKLTVHYKFQNVRKRFKRIHWSFFATAFLSPMVFSSCLL